MGCLKPLLLIAACSACLITNPSCRQIYLEFLFPSYDKPSKHRKTGPSAKPEGPLEKPKLDMGNVIIKTLLDQTLGATINTFLFATFTFSIQEAMSHRFASPVFAKPENSLGFLLSGKAVDYSRVDWGSTFDIVAKHFSSIMIAGWKLWPAVSLFNFACVKTVEMRNLVAALAGVAWGIYMSLFAAGEN